MRHHTARCAETIAHRVDARGRPRSSRSTGSTEVPRRRPAQHVPWSSLRLSRRPLPHVLGMSHPSCGRVGRTQDPSGRACSAGCSPRTGRTRGSTTRWGRD
jgi:hypothetical protein